MIAIVIEQITQTPKEFEICVHFRVEFCRLIRVERDSTSQLNRFLAFTVPTKLLGTPPFFQCILMALRVLEKIQ